MGKPKYLLFISLVLALFAISSSFSQITFRELPGYMIKSPESGLFDITSTRDLISLNGKWNVYYLDDKEQKRVGVSIPSVFEGEGNLVFEKSFQVTQEQLNNKTLRLYFLGLNYNADISVNNRIIYRHTGGDFPFSIDLHKDILRTNKKNILSVKLFYKLDSENTIPLKQRFLYPKNYGGIFRDVYLQVCPNISIAEASVYSRYDSRTGRVHFTIVSKIENFDSRVADSTGKDNNCSLNIDLISPSGSSSALVKQEFSVIKNKDKSVTLNADISGPVLWSPSNPQSYKISMELIANGSIVDRLTRSSAVFSLAPSKNSFDFNGEPFVIQAVEFVASNYDKGSMFSYDQMERDMRLIKETGFNTVRFAKTVPHPYYLQLCEQLGLIAFIELPLANVPAKLASDANFIQRSQNYLIGFIKAYSKYSAVGAIGLGEGYLAAKEEHANLLSGLAGIIKKNSNKVTYASFSGFVLNNIDNLDLYGIELINTPSAVYIPQLDRLKNDFGAGRIFVSGATYLVNSGNSDGYVNKYTFEAQAKYFEELIDFMNGNQFGGFCINSMFDYRGEYSSLLAGFSSESIYRIGIADEKRNTDRITYKVISSKLHNSEKVTIPIGTKKEDAPMIFIIVGILLAILLGILVNSGRKFREDSSRALLRPYNFYADIRDQRLISGMQSTFLAILVSAVSGLLLSNLLFYFKESLPFERILLSFGSHSIIKNVSFLSWHPISAILILTASSLVVLLVMTLIIRVGSLFVRNRVYLSSIFYTVSWSFLPLILFIPVGIVLYRLLVADVANTYLFLLLIIFTIWIFYRLMKGIYVIFDVYPGSVYFYSILFIVILLGGITLYFQLHNSFLDYLSLSINQNKLIR